MFYKLGLFIYYVYVLFFWVLVIVFVFFFRYFLIRCYEYLVGMSVFDSFFRNFIFIS